VSISDGVSDLPKFWLASSLSCSSKLLATVAAGGGGGGLVASSTKLLMLAIPSAFRKFNSGGRLVLASKATAAALYASSPYPANSALFTNWAASS
jgi:hypothetical protein